MAAAVSNVSTSPWIPAIHDIYINQTLQTTTTTVMTTMTTTMTTTMMATMKFSKPPDPMAEEARTTDQCVTIALLLLGIPGNIVCLLVWGQNDHHNSSRIYLVGVAVADLLFLCCFLIYQLHMAWEISVLDFPAFCSMFPVVIFTFQYLSPLSILAFTVERFISVYFPIQRIVYCTVRRAKLTIVGLGCFAFAISSPYSYFYTVRYDAAHGRDICAPRVSLHEGGMTSVFSLYTTVMSLFCFVVGNCTIFILNVLVIVKVRHKTAETNQFKFKLSKNDATASEVGGQGTSFLHHHNHHKHRQQQQQQQQTGGGSSSSSRSCSSKATKPSSAVGGGSTGTGMATFCRRGRRRIVTTSMLLCVSLLQIVTTMPVSMVYAMYVQHIPQSMDRYRSQEEVNAAYAEFYRLNHVVIFVKEYAVMYYASKALVFLLTSAVFRLRVKRLLRLPCRGEGGGDNNSC